MLSIIVLTFPFPARVIRGEILVGCAIVERTEKINRSTRKQDNFFIGKKLYWSDKGKKSERSGSRIS
jgi:hypothetical protein